MPYSAIMSSACTKEEICGWFDNLGEGSFGRVDDAVTRFSEALISFV